MDGTAVVVIVLNVPRCTRAEPRRALMWGRRAAPAVSCPSDDNDRAHGVRAPHQTTVQPPMWGRRAAPAVSCPSDDNDRAHGVRAPH